MRNPVSTRQFEKDVKLAAKRWRDLSAIRAVMDALIRERPLEPRQRNHRLVGNWAWRYECHVAPDWLLIYKLDGTDVVFERTGTHSDLFQ